MRWCSVVLLGGLVSCVVPGADPPAANEWGPGQGGLLISVKTEEDRTALGSTWASERADAYELLLVGAGGNRAVDLGAGNGQVVAVDPGTWRVLVLAGIKRSSGSATAYLVGSASADGVVVTAGQRTPVPLVLKSIDLTVLPEGPAYWKSTVAVGASGKTRNPHVGMLLAGASTTSRPRFKSLDLWNGYREMTTVSGTPDDWSAQATGTVPDGLASVSVGLVGAGLCIQDAGDAWVPVAGWTKYSWFWSNRADLVDTHPLAPLSETVFAANAPPVGVDLAITWE